jgi:hypothetical protein
MVKAMNVFEIILWSCACLMLGSLSLSVAILCANEAKQVLQLWFDEYKYWRADRKMKSRQSL